MNTSHTGSQPFHIVGCKTGGETSRGLFDRVKGGTCQVSRREDGLKDGLRIAVRSLVEQVLRSGDLELDFFSAARTIDAIRAHQVIQRSRPSDYQAEVPVSGEVDVNGLVLTVSGRLDGLFTKAGAMPIVEEIKTTTQPLDVVCRSDNVLHWGQLKVYAYLYATEHNVDPIGAQLTYYQIETGRTRTISRHFQLPELDAFFHALVRQYVEWAEMLNQWRAVRDRSASQLEFPFGSYRAGQRRMAAAVYRTIRREGQLIVQAATGIGKTMAVIFPAVKALGLGLTSKVFYLTARTTARSVAQNTFDILASHGLRIKTLTLTAKDKICFEPEAVCSAESCPFARGYHDRINTALKDIFNIDAFGPEAITDYAERHRVCPFEFSLELSSWADAVICDYNYVFDPKVYLRRFFELEENDYTLLIDEAHNLVDRSREMFSAELRKKPFLEVRRQLKDQLPPVYRSMGRINTWMLTCRKKTASADGAWSDPALPEALPPLLRQFLRGAEKWLASKQAAPFRDALMELYFACASFLRVADEFDQNYAACYTVDGSDLKVRLFCIDPSSKVRLRLRQCGAVVFFSATMTPADYFKQMFGCDHRVEALRMPSPFAPRHLGVFIIKHISTYYRHRLQTAPAVAQAIETLVTAKKGKYMVFCPSYPYLQQIHAQFTTRRPEMETIVQVPGMAENDRNAFLSRFSDDTPLALVGFAVMGGIFGEGIDLVGERLSGAAIIGVGLPAMSVERELIRVHFAKSQAAGFEFAYVFPGINRVLQAAGRVIRSESDRGVVMLVDQRYGSSRYRSLLPREWQPAPSPHRDRLEASIRQFWQNQDRAGTD